MLVAAVELDDARVADLAELVQASIEPAEPFRDLSDDERAGLAAAAEDFKTGRTYTPEQYKAEMDDFMARMRAKYPSAT